MNILEIKNLKKVYAGKFTALDDLSLSVKKGSFIALLGPNGAGKSTLINILSDCVRKSQGAISLSGFDFDKDKINYKKRIGVVPQEIVADPFHTPYSTLMGFRGLYGLKPDPKLVNYLLERVSLGSKKNVNNRNLSGGMKRRLLIAKALVHDPDLVILDEPTAGVDVTLRKNLWSILSDLKNQGKTVILTTHYLEEAETLCDKVAIINSGKLVVYKPTQDLLDEFGYNRLIVTVSDNVYISTLNELRSSLPFEHNFADGQLYIKYNKDKDLVSILNVLVNKNIPISGFSVQKSNLEDVFLKLTT